MDAPLSLSVLFLRVLRLLRLSKLIRFFRGVSDNFKSVWKVLRLVMVLGITTHWMACAFITLVHMQPESEHAWHIVNHIDDDPYTQYCAAAYAGVLSMVGDDIGPQTNYERAFLTLAVLLGSGLFAAIFGQGTVSTSSSSCCCCLAFCTDTRARARFRFRYSCAFDSKPEQDRKCIHPNARNGRRKHATDEASRDVPTESSKIL